jgi:hypothetical protein
LAAAVQGCNAVLAVIEHPRGAGGQELNGDSLAFRSCVASAWRAVTSSLSVGSCVPVAVVHDWPSRAAPSPDDFARLLCPAGAVWPSVVHEGPPQVFRAVRDGRDGGFTVGSSSRSSSSREGGGFDVSALDAALRWCASASWSAARVREEQMTLGEVFEAMLARCESLNAFYRCGQLCACDV